MLGVWNKGYTGTFKVQKSFYSAPHPFSLVPRPFSIFRMGSGNEASIHWYWWQQIWISVNCAHYRVWLTSIPLVACIRAEELVLQNIFPEWFWLPFKELVKMYFTLWGYVVTIGCTVPSKGPPENPALLCVSDALYVVAVGMQLTWEVWKHWYTEGSEVGPRCSRPLQESEAHSRK